MAFSLIYPQHEKPIQPTAIVFGRLGKNVLSVTGRMFTFSPSTVIYAVRMGQVRPNLWRLAFTGLQGGNVYHLEILDQNGSVVATANDLEVAASAEDIAIDYPDGSMPCCPDLMAVGTTTRPDDPLHWIKAKKGTEVFTGVEDLRIGNTWSVIFNSPPLDQGNGYTLEIGHDEAGAETVDFDVDEMACAPVPDPGADPDPLPDPPPMPGANARAESTGTNPGDCTT